MDSCVNDKTERVGSVTVEDLRKDLFHEFSRLSRESMSLEKEHLHVYLRVRPFTAAESSIGESQGCISVEPPGTVILKAPRLSFTARQSERFGPQLVQRFQFSQVYGPETTQRQIFEGTTKCLVKDVLEGGNALVFTYGVTNAGKTFTFLGPETDGGILPKSLSVIFNSIEGKMYSQNNIKPHRCVDFTRLTKEQQDEESTNKRNLLRRFASESQKTLSSVSSSSFSSLESSASSDGDDGVCLDEDSCVKFSVWVSFCEIYNENIHDLLDLIPNGSHKRNVLRLAQDVKGNAFVKDLKWVHVNSTEEAIKIVKIGRKYQSFSSTKLNNISSRSHSVFSIRVLRIEDTGVPRVQTISELSLCDLAGSERCAKTQNRGDRLKEAGNINTSLLTLGKCIHALRLNQTRSKFHQHIPFRESKLTHYLQGFFCGRGKACMIVNVNQCASMYDETLNVLKFSAVAQKVMVVNPKPAPSIVTKRSARDVSMMINNADQKDWTRRSSLMGWEMSLEDVQEDEDDEELGEEEVESDEERMEEETVLEAPEDPEELQKLQMKIEELKDKLSKEESEKLVMEARIREEVTTEFMELFSNMEKDYNERLQREKEIVEERADRRLEILKNLVNKTMGELAADHSDESAAKETEIKLLDSIIDAMRDDLTKIKGDAEAVQTCLADLPESLETANHLRSQLKEKTEQLHKTQQLLSLKTKEFEAVCAQTQESNLQLSEAMSSYENQKITCQELMAICQEKDDMISKLQSTLDQNVKAATKDRELIDSIKEEILHLRSSCKCVTNKDGVCGEEEVKTQEFQQLLQELKVKDDQLNKLKLEQRSLEMKVCDLSEKLAEETSAHEATASSLAMKKAMVTKITNDNKELANELRLHQQAANDVSSKLRAAQMELNSQTKVAKELSEELTAAKAQIKRHQEESCSWSKTIESLRNEADRLRLELGANQMSRDEAEALRHECERMVESSLEKNRRIADLEQEVSQTQGKMSKLEELSSYLRRECDAQVQEHKSLLSHYEAEKVTMAQMRRNSELLRELTVLKQQLAKQKEDDSGDDCWKTLLERLMQTLNAISRNEEVLKAARVIVENQVSKAREEAERRMNEMEKDLAHKETELENKAQELSKSRELVNNGLQKMKTMSCDLQQLDEERLKVRDKLHASETHVEQLQKQILSLTDENRSIQQRLCKAEEMRDQALHSLSCKERSIDLVQNVQSNHSKEENIQLFQTAPQDLSAEHKPVENINFNNKINREKLLETESITKDGAKLQGSCQKGTVEPQQQGAETEPKEDIKQTSDVMTVNDCNSYCPTQEVAALDSSVLSTKSLTDERFPKPELEISFTPLKPDRMNVRRPGEESVTIKLRRTARKRKGPEVENSVESKNRKNGRLKMNKENMQAVETPEVQGRIISQQQDSPSTNKGKKDGALQKIGELIQSSPTLFGSKAKKIINMVKSPSENIKPKRSKRKLFKNHVSSPMDIPSYPVIGSSEDKESDHLIIKRKLRTRTVK